MLSKFSSLILLLAVVFLLEAPDGALAQSRLASEAWKEFKIVARQYDSLQSIFKEMVRTEPSLARNPMLMQERLKADMPAITAIFRAVPDKAQPAMQGLGDLAVYGSEDLNYIKLAAIAINDLNTCKNASERLLALLKSPDSIRTVQRELAQLLSMRGEIEAAAKYASDEAMSDANDMERGQIYSAIATGFSEGDRPADAHPFAIKTIRAFRAYKEQDTKAEGMPKDSLQLQEIVQQHRHFIITQIAKPMGQIMHGYRASGDSASAARFIREAELALDDPVLWPETKSAAEAYVSQLAEEQREMTKPAAEWAEHRWIGSEPLSLKGLEGKVVLIDFFATWCRPCIMAFPHIKEWSDKYADQGLVVLGLTTFQGRYDGRTVTPDDEFLKLKDDFIPKHKVSWPVAVEKSGSKTFQDYGVNGIPHISLIDRGGILRYFKVGAGEYDKTERMIKKLLAEKSSKSKEKKKSSR